MKVLSKLIEFLRIKFYILRYGKYFRLITANDIVGLDMSHWQGANVNWQKMKNAGVKFVILKCSEGTYYKDDRFASYYAGAKSVGLKIGAYHFVSTENADAQFRWFVSCMGNYKFDLVPALDVEYANISEALVDAIGKRLEALILQKPDQFPTSYPHPAIYTNVSLGNSIFKTKAMNRYPLWLATRNTSTPPIPKIWKSKGIYVWQNAVVGGSQYGISGNVDHNYWGTVLPFPGDEPPPPPVIETKEFIITVETNLGKYSNKVKLEKQ